MTSNKKAFVFVILTSIILINISFILGSSDVSVSSVYKVILSKIFSLDLGVNASEILLIWNIRVPRVLMAFSVGFAISMSGCILQQITRNPLASTYTMGVSGGASIGIALVIMFGLNAIFNNILITLMSFMFGMGTMFVVLHIANVIDKTLSNSTIILVGFVISIFTNSLLMSMATLNKEYYQKIMSFQLGTFAYSNIYEILWIVIIILLCTIALYIFRLEIDILGFGENTSETLGVNVRKIKLIAIVIGSILCGISVAFAGIIAFVDLIAPHISRKFVGSKIVPSSLLAGFVGGSLMCLSDLLARTIIAPAEISVGIITSLVGAPFFLIIFIKKRGGEKF